MLNFVLLNLDLNLRLVDNGVNDYAHNSMATSIQSGQSASRLQMDPIANRNRSNLLPFSTTAIAAVADVMANASPPTKVANAISIEGKTYVGFSGKVANL